MYSATHKSNTDYLINIRMKKERLKERDDCSLQLLYLISVHIAITYNLKHIIHVDYLLFRFMLKTAAATMEVRKCV